ncbi:hypothetical protein HanIR_Chr07g0319491 [Helianthus annuus]|nr:hypothetical protein HanIR_Chr07g0319491 [Helianthus annuus]
MIFNARYPELERSGNTLEFKPMGPACFYALTSKRGTEKKFEGLIPLEKFGQFAETEDVAAEPVLVQLAPMNAAPVNAPVNAIIAEEHTVQGATEEEPETEILTINSYDEGIEITMKALKLAVMMMMKLSFLLKLKLVLLFLLFNQ